MRGCAAATVKGAKGATGWAYKELQKLLDVQCHDKHCAHSQRCARSGSRTARSSSSLLPRSGASGTRKASRASSEQAGADAARVFTYEKEEEEEADDFNGAAEHPGRHADRGRLERGQRSLAWLRWVPCVWMGRVEFMWRDGAVACFMK